VVHPSRPVGTEADLREGAEDPGERRGQMPDVQKLAAELDRACYMSSAVPASEAYSRELPQMGHMTEQESA